MKAHITHIPGPHTKKLIGIISEKQSNSQFK